MEKKIPNEDESQALAVPENEISDETVKVGNRQRYSVIESDQRAVWGGKFEFFLSLLGYAVSLENIWRFPYLCYRNGGGAFLIPYISFLLICGIPLFVLEVAMGQFSSQGAIKVWNFCPFLKGVGIGTLMLTTIACTTYNLMMGYILYYLFSSMTPGTLPWGTCDNKWNSLQCLNLKNTNSSTLKGLEGIERAKTSSYEFWSHGILQISGGLDQPGHFNTKLSGCFFLGWIIVFLCLIRGIKSTGKIVYFTATFPYVILTVLLIRSMLLPGAVDGLIFFLKPDWKLLKKFKVWNEAATQIFHSLGPGWGGLITMASFNKFRHNFVRDSITVSVINCGTSVYAGLVVFSVVGFMAHVLGIPIEKVASQGVGLAFVVYPEALLHLPMARMWSILFFLMLLTVGMDTLFVQMEVVYSAIYDAVSKKYRVSKICVNMVATVIMILLGIPFLFQNGIYLFQLVDWYIALLPTMVFCIIETIAISWIYGVDRFLNDVEFMLKHKFPGARFFKILWKFIVPFLLTITLIMNVCFYVPVEYDTYNYSQTAISLGWLISAISLVPVPIYFLYKVQTKRGTFKQKLRAAAKPAPEWGPSLDYYRQLYFDPLRRLDGTPHSPIQQHY